MKQREIQDKEKTIWTCTQAFSGTNGKAAKEAAEKATDAGKVTVVCTPSGGEQTVRLELTDDWDTNTSDEALLKALLAEREQR